MRFSSHNMTQACVKVMPGLLTMMTQPLFLSWCDLLAKQDNFHLGSYVNGLHTLK